MARPASAVALVLVGAAGLLVVSLAFAVSRSHPGSVWAQVLFWEGLGLIVLPPTARLVSARPGRGERVALMLAVGSLLYLVKVVHDPFGFTYADEWVHVYNVERILRTGRLFGGNPIIPVTARYPGLEALTVALVSLTHLSVFAAGVVVLAAARLIFLLALFLLVEALTGSARVAALAGILYATNPNFVFWSAEFSYESIALPLAVFAALAVVKTWPPRGGDRSVGSHAVMRWAGEALRPGRAAWTAVACLATLATVMSHHLTSIALTLFLLLVCAVASLRRSSRRQAPWLVAGFAVVATALWLGEVAPGTWQYLSPVLAGAFHQTIATLLGHTSGRAPFAGGGGGQVTAPIWQRVVAIGSVAMIVAALPLGLLAIRRRFSGNPFVIVLGFAAILYVAVLPMRLVPAAWETSNRSSEFLFVGVALTLALVRPPVRLAARALPVAASAFVAVLLIGGIVAGWPPRVLLALPSRARAAGGVTLVPQPEAVADWSRRVLGPGHRFLAPEAVGRELLVDGDQNAFVTSAPFDAASVLFGNEITSGIVQTLSSRLIGYVAEDRLALGDDNMAGYFFNSPGGAQLVDPASYTKFDAYPGVDRILDSGDIYVYDVRTFLGAP